MHPPIHLFSSRRSLSPRPGPPSHVTSSAREGLNSYDVVEEAVHDITTIVHDVRKRAHNLETSLAINAANTPRCSLMGSVDRIRSLGVLGCKSLKAIDARPNRLSRTDALPLPGPTPIRPGRACFELSGWDDEKTVPTNTSTGIGKDGRNFLGRTLIFGSSTDGWLQSSQAVLLSQNVFARSTRSVGTYRTPRTAAQRLASVTATAKLYLRITFTFL
ncbi:hypothetical protein T05_1864 [Trichinella murrelli]|uniref:Uncharacterized protein n=1 Tax=Trichinella murrelli TaxID=144512 RepID=A0A0V0T0T6_9BILA|nr:hypothetical protein T05_1864 [Trichinella murrelli]